MRKVAFLHWVSGVVVAGGALLFSGCYAGEGGPEEAAQQPLNENENENDKPGCGGGACTTEAIGDPATCQPYSDLKTAGYEACVALGLTLVDLKFIDCGDGTANQVTATCCAEPPKPPPPPDDPGVCVGELLGDGQTCQAPDLWKDQAYQHCAAAGLTLSDLGLSHDCADGGSSYAKVLCCEPKPPPEPSDCTYGALGDGSTCEQPDHWKNEAFAACEAQGLVLTDVGFAHDCANGGSSVAKYACCEP